MRSAVVYLGLTSLLWVYWWHDKCLTKHRYSMYDPDSERVRAVARCGAVRNESSIPSARLNCTGLCTSNCAPGPAQSPHMCTPSSRTVRGHPAAVRATSRAGIEVRPAVGADASSVRPSGDPVSPRRDS